MKKVLVLVTLIMGLGTSVAFAYNYANRITEITVVNDFTPIEIKDIPAAIQESITKNYSGLTIKEAAVQTNEDGTKLYRVILLDQDSKTITTFFKDNGEEVKAETAE